MAKLLDRKVALVTLQIFTFDFSKESRGKAYEIGFIQFDFISDSVFQYGLSRNIFDRLPQAPGSTGMVIHLHGDNADELAARVIAAGATMVREPSDAFYGERSCTIRERL